MLILNRKIGQRVVIGGDTVLGLIHVQGGTATLALSSPFGQWQGGCETGTVLSLAPGVTAEVLQVKGQYVRLGIKAPPAVRVDREEIAQLRLGGSTDPLDSTL